MPHSNLASCKPDQPACTHPQHELHERHGSNRPYHNALDETRDTASSTIVITHQLWVMTIDLCWTHVLNTLVCCFLLP
jgi:hypothetical protein